MVNLIETRRKERATKYDTHRKAGIALMRHRWDARLIADMGSSYDKLFNRYHANTYFKSSTGRQWIAREEDQLVFNDWEVLSGTHDMAGLDARLPKEYAKDLDKLIEAET